MSETEMSTGSTKMAPEAGGAVVRMYCAGLGDCFLLGFRAKDGETSYVLIDCGVWKGTPGATLWMQRIMQHILDEVGERGIDLLVATHQHWDHLSGFSQAKEIFEKLRVKQVWLPWTEDPGDHVALRIAEERRLAVRTAIAAIGQLRARFEPEDQDREKPSVLRTTVENLEAVLKFAGYTPPEDADAAEDDAALLGLGFSASSDLLGAGPSTDDLMDIVRKKVDQPQYIRPSLEPLTLNDLPDVKIYALGPPTDPKYLGKDDPSTAPGKSEVYVTGMPLNEDLALYAAAFSLSLHLPLSDEDKKKNEEQDSERRELTCPFDRWQRYSREDAEANRCAHSDFFHSRYLDESDRAPAWRRIDTDWLEAAGQLALNLDDHVNNTSLALAFELGEGGPVLLFPGDAQVGNWLSWHELKKDHGLTAESLLNRTVLYKVGHHASHNATLKDKGLKLMTSTSRLVAMIPVDEGEAHKPKGRNKNGWAMPYDKLLADLKVRTEGRVLRADKEPEEPKDGEIEGWSKEKKTRWGEFRKKVTDKKEEMTLKVNGEALSVKKTLFLQYTVTRST